MDDSRIGAESTKLDDIIAQYIFAEEAGESVSREELIEQHPDLSDDLKQFFADRDRFKRLAGPLSPEASRNNDLPATVRYFGDYELLEEVAQGGMGVVYKARQTSLNRIVAVKMILAGHLASDDDVKRFTDEAETAASLRHKAIVPIHEVGQQKGQHYFSMDYIQGKNLAELIRTDPPSASEAAGIVKAVAEAVDYAHQEGIVHRDIKPSNILIDQTGQVHITDFGLAMRVEGDSELTRSGQVLGTPSYMSPEQAAAKRDLIGPASDIYSLGAILYELLTGRPPFRGETAVETIRQVIDTEPLAPRRLQRKTPRDLETICLKCLSKEPHKRYGTAALLADDIGRFHAGEPIQARPVGQLERAWRWCKRKPAATALIGVSILASLLLVTSLGISNILMNHAHDKLSKAHNELQLEEQRTARALKQVSEAKVQIESEQGKTKAALSDSETANAKLGRLLADARVDSYSDRLGLAEREWVAGNARRAKYLLDTCDQALRGWEWRYVQNLITTGNTSLVLDAGQRFVFSVAFSPDGKWLASGSTSYWNEKEKRTKPGRVMIWDVSTAEAVFDVVVDMHVCSVAFSPDGKRLLAGGFGGQCDGVLKSKATIWNLDSEEIEFTLPPTSEPGIFAAIFCPDGKRIVTGGVHNAQVWDLETGEEEAEFPSEAVHRLALSPDGKLLAVAGRGVPKMGGSVRFWNLLTGGEVSVLRPSSPLRWIHGLSFSSNGKLFATSGGHRFRNPSQQPEKIKIWDTQSGLELLTIEGRTSDVFAVDFSRDATRIVSAGGEWNATMNQGRSFGQTRTPTLGNTPSTELSDLPADVTVWDVVTGKELFLLRGHVGSVFCVAFSPDGTHIASGGSDNAVRIWSAAGAGDADKAESRRTNESTTD